MYRGPFQDPQTHAHGRAGYDCSDARSRAGRVACAVSKGAEQRGASCSEATEDTSWDAEADSVEAGRVTAARTITGVGASVVRLAVHAVGPAARVAHGHDPVVCGGHAVLARADVHVSEEVLVAERCPDERPRLVNSADVACIPG